MKTEMKMLPNGNYEKVISTIQHRCIFGELNCVEYSWENKKLRLEIEIGDPYEDGFSYKTEVKFCPFCGYSPKDERA